jgi:hypothetical protein
VLPTRHDLRRPLRFLRWRTPARVRRIAVLRANAIGDYIVGLPALMALRRAYPLATIVLWAAAGMPSSCAGAMGRSTRCSSCRRYRAYGRTRRPGRRAAIDAARSACARVDSTSRCSCTARSLQQSVPASPRARSRRACAPPDAEPLEHNLPYHDDHHPAALQLLECVALVGAAEATLEVSLRLRAEDIREAAHVLPPSRRATAAAAAGRQPCPQAVGAGALRAVGDAFAASGALCGGARHLRRGRPHRRRVPRDAAAGHRPGRPAVGGRTRRAAGAHRLLVSNDTGPVHLARALGTPTVSIFWSATCAASARC